MKKLIFIFPLITLFLVNTSLFAAGKLNVAVIGNEPDLRAKIESLLANTDFLQPVERTRIDSLLKEMKLGQQGILKEGTFARAGESLGAQYLVLVEKGSNSFKIVHTQSSRILGSWNGLTELTSEEFLAIFEREKAFQELASLKSSGKRDYKIEVTNAIGSKDNGGAVIGEELKVEFIVKSKQESLAYITILVYGQDGSVTQLFPNKYQSDNKISTNVEFQFPPKDAPQKYKLLASNPVGEDTMVIIASDTPVVLPNSVPQGIYKGNTKSLAGTKGITLQLDKTGKMKYDVNRVTFEIREK
ncbi:MAG: DUF4384 domain-containing protein [Leptospiraceae bacterium]|nr:DUF4384 domain-containing protein [Leptospiraceae bacterium]